MKLPRAAQKDGGIITFGVLIAWIYAVYVGFMLENSLWF